MKEYCEVCHNTCDHVNKVELGELNHTNVDLCDKCFEKVKTDCKSTYQLVGICEDITVTRKDHEDDHFDKGELYAVHDGIATAFAMLNLSSVGLGRMVHMAAEAEIEKAKEEIHNKAKAVVDEAIKEACSTKNKFGKSPMERLMEMESEMYLGKRLTADESRTLVDNTVIQADCQKDWVHNMAERLQDIQDSLNKAGIVMMCIPEPTYEPLPMIDIRGNAIVDNYKANISEIPKHDKPRGEIQSCYVCGNSHTTLRNYGCGDYICQSCYKKRYEVYEG